MNEFMENKIRRRRCGRSQGKTYHSHLGKSYIFQPQLQIHS